MTIKITTSLLTAFILIAAIPNARAEIASRQYVDERNNTYLFGTANPSEQFFNTLGYDDEDQFKSYGIVDMINTETQRATNLENRALRKDYQEENAFIVTDASGRVSTASGGFITNAKISSSANIELGKLQFPTAPASCSSTGCMLMFYNNQYIWEPVTRDNSETISTTGAVSSTPTATTSNVYVATPASCTDWNAARGECDD